MKEIKFRAWDKRTKQMFHNENFLDLGRLLIAKAKQLYPDAADVQNAKGGLMLTTDDGNMVFMQFTGHRDDNGKEIYDGDILAIDWAIPNETTFAIVTWNSEEYGFNYVGFGCKDGGNSLFEIKDRVIEIIGNIYENQELMDKGET